MLGNAILGSTSSLLHSTQIADPDVQQFLATTDPSTYVQSDLNFVVGSQCTSWAKPLPAPQTSSWSSISDEAYISGLESFIENANIKDVINAGLISWFAAHYQTIAQQVAHASLGGIWVNSPESQTADAVANTYAEQAFGLGDSQCDASCAGMSLWAQMQCQLGCARSCISQCAGLGATDKALCIVNCSCFMVSGPIGSGGAWNQIENMFSIKFCKAPVSTTDSAWTTLISLETNSPWKVVSSLEGIFDEIAGILEGLKNSGKTVKYVKPKEFLDPSIKLKFADILDFKILVDFKPIFPKRTVTPTPVTTATDSSSENYNKYVVISDVAKNKAELQPYATQAELDTDVQDMQDVADLTQSSPSSSAITVAQNGKFALLSEDIMDFLTSHQAFWNQLSTSLESLLEDTIVLKGKIENSD